MTMRHTIILLTSLTIALSTRAAQPDTAFWQEYHEAWPLSASAADRNVRSIAVDTRNNIWIATGEGVFRKNPDQKIWQAQSLKGPAYSILATPNTIWIGAWNGLYHIENNTMISTPGVQGPVSAICAAPTGIYALGPKGAWLVENNHATKIDQALPRSIRGAICDKTGSLWIASDVGLYHNTERLAGTELLLSASLKSLAFDENNRLWAAGLGGVSILTGGLHHSFLTPHEGLPSIYINAIKQAPDGTMWVGTKTGVVRFRPDGSHSLRFSKRWLLDDQVNDIAFDAAGNAWIATREGVSAIMRRHMTLASKQDYFYDVLMKRHIRAPWIAGQCHLDIPGDVNSFQPEDDDNDGEFTGNYLAMESFRFAATKDEDAHIKAGKAFRFLALEEEITGGDGYFARTIVPAEWADRVHDNNRRYTPQEIAEEEVQDPRYKPVSTRWRRSADGKWLWKGDASSDEWCGHFLGYFFYYQLAATENEKALVRKHVSRLLNHLIAHDFYMMDIDGTHTHWSVWSPNSLNRDPEWSPDRSLNSMEILSFLKFGYYITGDTIYQHHYRRLIEKEHYLDNMSNISRQDPAWFIYYDATMQAYLYPILLHCEKDPALLAYYRQHITEFANKRRGDHNPLIDFLCAYAMGAPDATRATGNPGAMIAHFEPSADIEFLTDTPLDLIDWAIDHGKREDVHLVHAPVLDEWQTDQLPPASIRQTVRWDKNPWTVSGGNPDMEREPVFWLFPYWMGRYLKFIQPAH